MSTSTRVKNLYRKNLWLFQNGIHNERTYFRYLKLIDRFKEERVETV